MGNKGMATLEACVIIPLTLAVTFLLLWTGILLYDRAAVSGAVSVAVIQGSRMSEESKEEIMDHVRKKTAELLEGKLVMMEMPQMEVKVSYAEISASLHGEINAPVLAGFSGLWRVEAERRADRMRIPQIVRTIQRIDRTIEKAGNGKDAPKDGGDTGTEE